MEVKAKVRISNCKQERLIWGADEEKRKGRHEGNEFPAGDT